MDNLRVVSLTAENVLRLGAVDFEWKNDQHVLTLGGRNGAGKSSVLNALAMALGGAALCPTEPIKRGEHRGFVELDLGGLVVRREFWRDLLSEQPENGPAAYGETKSRLVVRNPEGVKQEPAQRLLDKLVGKLTFDPLAFAMESDARKQADTLRMIVGLDFKEIDEARKTAYDKRTGLNRECREKLAQLDAMQQYSEVPDSEINIDALADEMSAITKAANAADDAEHAAQTQRGLMASAVVAVQRKYEQLADLDEQIAALQTKRRAVSDTIAPMEVEKNEAAAMLQRLDEDASVLRRSVPSTLELSSRIKSAQETNEKVRANTARQRMMNQVVAAQGAAEEQTTLLEQCDTRKTHMIRDAKYPIDGLGIAADGAVTFKGLPLSQASTAEQIRVSVAIGFALNPSLKLLCVRNGNALDEDSRAEIVKCAEHAGGQVLMEIVTKTPGDVSVFIEDGHTSGK